MKPTRTTLTRRSLLFSASALGLTLLLPKRRARAAGTGKPRFLLHITASGGLDTTMLFDARPRAMTAAGAILNPLGEEPIAWVGDNGTSALSASTAAPLHGLRDRFSVINGVLMATNFDGHDQNLNLFLTGNPFGGRSFNAEINLTSIAPLDYVRLGPIFATLQDTRNVELTAPGLQEVVDGVRSLSTVAPSVDDFLRGQSEKLGDPYDRFGAGVLGLGAATTESKVLAGRLADIELGEEPDPFESKLSIIREVFRLGIARGAMFSIDDAGFVFDTHAGTDAQAQAPNYRTLTTQIARVFQFLAETSYDGTQSLLDVTTVVVGSEFGRTMRQLGVPIDQTGTDHNPLSNSVLVGGAGIRGGLVVGQSDFQSATESLSATHLSLDPDRVKTMGKPFDFTTQQPRTDRPQEYVAADYLQIGSVVNTIYSLFEVDQAVWRRVDRSGPAAPILTSVLA